MKTFTQSDPIFKRLIAASLGKLSFLWVGVSLLFLFGCVAGQGGKKQATCPNGQTYDTLGRSCKGAIVVDEPPVPSLSATSILEDSGVNQVELTYTDNQNDLAASCSISAANSTGLVKQKSNQGILYKSKSSISDPQNTVVFIQSGGSTSVTADTSISGLRGIIITVTSTSTALDVVTKINAHATVSQWVSASALSFGTVAAISGSFAIDEISCSCVGGVCKAALEPADNYYGTTDFIYNLTDKDGTSINQTVKVNITSVNDNPVISLIGSITGVTERFNTDYTSVKTGNLFTDGVITRQDTADGDPFGAYVYAELVSNPTYGVIYLQSSGDYSYYTYKEQTSDSFQVRLIDSQGGVSSNVTVPVYITTVNDPPVGTTPNPSAILEDSAAATVNLTYTDEEGDSAVSCAITSVTNVYPVGGCSCTAGSCSVSIAPIPDAKGTGSFKYRIYDATGNTPVDDTVSMVITSAIDSPIVFTTAGGGTLQFMESDTYLANTYSFALDGASHADGTAITSYSMASAPSYGKLSGCLGQSGSGLNCTYTPDDGNLSDSASLSAIAPSGDLAVTAATDSGTFYAASLGDTYNGLNIELVDIGESMATLFGTNAKAYFNNSKVTILFQAGVTSGADISTAVNANSDVSKIITFNSSGGTQNTATTLSLTFGATLPKDSFQYTAYDANGGSTTKKVYISIIPTPDRPTMCEYSTYADTTVCGLNGCIGNNVPTGITPDKDGLIYYSLTSGACYESSNGSWTPVVSYIANRSVNELDPVVIDSIRIDEGGGGTEDAETLSITSVDSSDTNLIPLGNIEFYYDGVKLIKDGSGHYPVGDVGSADLKKFKVVITPQTINPPVTTKSSEIQFIITDSSNLFTKVVFTVDVQKVSATHGGWIFFSATGPKVDSLGLVNEDRTVCPYSLDMCESGQKCYGSNSPINNSFADPDYVDAIYLQESGSNRTCYRMKRTAVQKISYVGKTSTGATVQYVDAGGTTDSASVSVNTSNNVITVTINADYTTTDTIITEIRGNSSANALVKAINLKAGETQVAQSAVSIAPLSNANWESFETYCSATPVAFETACSSSDGTNCMGQSAPSFTPSMLDRRYWDEQANVCYKSVGTTSSSDWVAYDAPAEVTISWNQFTINGSASIDEYRVYRRLVNEEFDFSMPINKTKISGGSSTYTYVDNNANSVTPPSPGTVYYYVVRPVVNGILTSTAAETGTNATGIVRIMAPPKNMAFAHRWMINKTMCDLMNRATDSTNNYRCLYEGAGDATISSAQYYDYGKDILVDRFEAGCPYSSAPNCPQTYDNSCIGVADPTTAGITATSGLIYYDRSNGGCYYADGATWSLVSGSNIASYLSVIEPNAGNIIASNSQFDTYTDKRYNRAGLPPFTQITQPTANALCSGLTALDNTKLLGIANTLSHRLPTRKDQVAYSQWDTSNKTDNEIGTLETGLSLNSTSKCNSSGASGLESGYVDIDKPDSIDFYSLPGTLASNIRSMTTGSNELASCVSKFGVQDAVGNVAEWTSHGLNCPLMSTCSSNENLIIQDIEYTRVRPAGSGFNIGITYVTSGAAGVSADGSGNVTINIASLADQKASTIAAAVNAASISYLTAQVIGDPNTNQNVFGTTVYMGNILTNADDTDFKSSLSDPYGYWTLDGKRGPCVDSDADGICDAALGYWAYADERNSAGRFMSPVGLVAHVTANSTFATNYDLFEIGPTSGITALQLHDDTITINSDIIGAEASGCGKMATGGSYMTGNGAGVWNMEAVPCSDVIASLTIQDVTFRILNTTHASLAIRYIDDGSLALETVAGVKESGGILYIDLASLASPSPAEIAVAVINYYTTVGSGEVEAFVSGNQNTTQVAFTTAVTVNNYQTTGQSKRSDVGFRCVIDVNDSDYD